MRSAAPSNSGSCFGCFNVVRRTAGTSSVILPRNPSGASGVVMGDRGIAASARARPRQISSDAVLQANFRATDDSLGTGKALQHLARFTDM
jgi:hypothetical protein